MLRFLLTVLTALIALNARADALSLGDPGWSQTGKASYYSSRLHGKRTASGEPYDETDLTAAHPALQFGTLIKVTNTYNGRSVSCESMIAAPLSATASSMSPSAPQSSWA